MEQFTVHLDISGVEASDKRVAMDEVEMIILEQRPGWIVAVHEAKSHKEAFGDDCILNEGRK